MTREQVAVLLYRYFNLAEEKNYENPYGDVSEESTSYIKEILSLTEMGVLRVTSTGTLDRRHP